MKNHVWLKLATAASVASLAACGGNNSIGGATGEITLASDTTTVKANDLRGLTFANDGKIYASGHTDADPADRKIVVARFNADGSPDTSFSDDGFAELNVVEGGIEQTLSIVELAGGDIVIAVNAGDLNGGEAITPSDNPAATPGVRAEGSSVFLVRLGSDGAPVTSFGEDGRAEVVFGWANADNAEWPVPDFSSTEGFSHAGFPTDTAYDLKLDPTGGATERLVVFGFGSAPNVADADDQRVDVDRYVARVVASTGAADPSFNGGAAFTWTSAGTLNDNARRGIVEADGKITSCGYTDLGEGEGNHVVLFRLTTAGVLDATFTGFGLTPVEPGIAVFNPLKVDGGEAECYAVARQSSGAYVTTGYGAATDSGTPSTLGYETTEAQDLVTFRVANGAVDTSWGNDGTQVLQSEGTSTPKKQERGRHIAVLNDDRTVQVGYDAEVPAIYVLTPDGDLDSSVDGDGILELPSATIPQQFFAVAVSPDGKRIAASTSTDANGARLVILDVDA